VTWAVPDSEPHLGLWRSNSPAAGVPSEGSDPPRRPASVAPSLRAAGDVDRLAEKPMNIALVIVPPLVVFLLTLGAAGPPAALIAGTLAFFAMVALVAVRSRRRRRRASRSLTVTEPMARHVLDRVLRAADRIGEAWPALDRLIAVADAEAQLTEALWELAGVLVKGQQLRAVLAELSRPEFAQTSESDSTARQVSQQRRATRTALAAVDGEIVRRLAGIERAEAAGQAFLREEEMRQAIRAAEDSLRAVHDDAATAPGPARPDAGTELAEHTQSVLDAYRELTANPEPPEPHDGS
jgi:hypothetical protein